MKYSLQKINSLLGEINSLPAISEENQRKLDKKFRLEFNFNSNHIEGNTLTYGETELLLIFDKTEGVHEMREYEEMKAHDVAFKFIQEWASDKDFILAEKHIKELNEIILVRPFWKEAITHDGQQTRRLIETGQYKKYPNSVRLQNGEIFEYASPLETPMKMGDLMEWYNAESQKNELQPTELAALFHYKFVCIHPFDDGNGRISRLLMNYVLLKNSLPPVVIKTEQKKDYLNALNQADTGNIETFIEYVAEQLIWSLEIKRKAIRGESLVELGDLEKKLTLLKRKLNEEEKVTLKYSVESIKNTCINSILPLLKKWESKLEEFDVFFNSRNVIVRFDNKTSRDSSMVENFVSLYDTFYPIIGFKSPDQHVRIIRIDITLRELRNSKMKSNFNGGSVTISFHENAYEIDYTSRKESLSKLYSQYLSELEIEHIISAWGNWLFNNIESAIEKG